MKKWGGSVARALGVFLLVLLASPERHSTAAESPPSDAVDFVRQLSDAAVNQLTSPTISDPERVRRMRQLLVEAFDLSTVTRFVLGAHHNRLSREQLEQFNSLYVGYVAHNYAALLKHYSGQRVEVLGSKPAADGTEVVHGLIRQPSGPSFRIEMRVTPSGATYKAVDFRIEGVSMPLVHRKEFMSVIQRQNGVQALLKSLQTTVARFEAEVPSE